MSHQLELKAIRGLLADVENEQTLFGPNMQPLLSAIRMLTDIVESLERGHVHDTERPPPPPPTDPGDLAG